MMRRMAGLLATGALAMGTALSVQAAAIVPGFDANTMGRNDDGSTPTAVPLGFEVDLFGLRTSSVYVNINGNVTFDAPMPGLDPDTVPLQQLGRRVVAPFFADVDTTFQGNPVTYGSGTFEGRPAFGVNWIDVAHYSAFSPSNARNSFQLLLVSRADRASGDFDIVFNYDAIQWEASPFQGADDNGRGGSSARAGFALAGGTPGSSFELQGSARNGAFLNGGTHALASGRRNSDVAGRHVFEIRSSRLTQVSARTPFLDRDAEYVGSDAAGRYLVFQSAANSLSEEDNNSGTDVFRLDTRTGAIDLVSLDEDGSNFRGNAIEPSISADGNAVVFVGPDGGVYLRNFLTGSSQRIGDGKAGGAGTTPRISSSARQVVYVGQAADAAIGAAGQDNIFLVELDLIGNELEAGEPRCISCKVVGADGVDSNDNVNGAAASPDISGNGEVVVWQTRARNLRAGQAAPCGSAAGEIAVRDLRSGTVSIASTPSGGSCGAANAGNRAPRIDRAGSKVVFESDMPLVAADTNNVADIYVFEIGGALRRASERADGTQGNGASSEAAISGDGNQVVFTSLATNLDPNGTDANGATDLHITSLQSGDQRRLASNERGQDADHGGRRPSIAYDGSLIAFEAASSNLAPGAVANRTLVYQRSNPFALPVLRSATWWKSNEAGWGLFIFDQGSLLAPAWFTYDHDGEPTWFLGGGAFPQADGSYAGPLLRYKGVPFDRITGTAFTDVATVGDLVLRFEGDSRMSFRYTVDGISQEKSLTRFPFGTRNIACRASPTASRAAADNYSDVWYGGQQTNGWGLFVIHVDDLLFAIWYTYDADGEAVFFQVITERQPDGRFVGRVYRQPNGTPFHQINNAAPTGDSQDIGEATFSFQDGEHGVFSYRIGNANQSKPIERLQVGSLPTVCEPVAHTE